MGLDVQESSLKDFCGKEDENFLRNLLALFGTGFSEENLTESQQLGI